MTFVSMAKEIKSAAKQAVKLRTVGAPEGGTRKQPFWTSEARLRGRGKGPQTLRLGKIRRAARPSTFFHTLFTRQFC
jgi:hypothetical protein